MQKRVSNISQSYQTVLVIAVINVGYTLDVESYKPHYEIAYNFDNYTDPSEDYTSIYSLTKDGEPIGLNEYCIDLAKQDDNTHVMLLLDSDTSSASKLNISHLYKPP